MLLSLHKKLPLRQILRNHLDKTKIRLETRVSHSYVSNVRLCYYIWDGDDEIEKSLEEAAFIKFASGLRHCFVTMLVYPREVYEKFKEELCLDFAELQNLLRHA